MGKCLILKDAMNRPGGYAMTSQDSIACCAKGKVPAQAVLFFADGTQRVLELPDGTEQRLSGERRELTGCCVVCGEDVVLASDAAARSAWLRQKAGKLCFPARTLPEREQSMVEAKRNEPEGKITDGAEQVKEGNRTFPERRWPPPPCWNDAHYYDGCWQESCTLTRKSAACSAAQSL